MFFQKSLKYEFQFLYFIIDGQLNCIICLPTMSASYPYKIILFVTVLYEQPGSVHCVVTICGLRHFWKLR